MLRTHQDPDRSCARAREWASLRLDGELSELERLFLGRHLARCAECAAFADSLSTFTTKIRETPPELPSRSLRPARAPRAPLRDRFVFRMRVVAVAALVVVAGVVGVAVGTEFGPHGSPAGSTSVPNVVADLQPENVPIRPRPVGRTANV